MARCMLRGSLLMRNLVSLRVLKGGKSRQFGVIASSGTGDSVLFTRDEHRHRITTTFCRDYTNTGRAQQGDGLLISGAVLVVLGAFGFIYYKKCLSKCSEAENKDSIPQSQAGMSRPDLPDYSRNEIRKRNSKDTGIWVTYQNGVYNITQFLAGHPGGDRIMLAAGGPLEPFWQMYTMHNSSVVCEILESLRIGNVHPDDMENHKNIIHTDDPYINDPARHPALNVLRHKPYCAETPAELLADSFLTPNELFFIRNHFHSPRIEDHMFTLEFSGIGLTNLVSFTLKDLKEKFQHHSVIAAVQCTGNRRGDMHKVKKLMGVKCGNGLISNAQWTGVKLSDVLMQMGAREGLVKHAIFQGADKGPDGIPYEASIPAESAFDPRKDVLLAYEMNGEELPIDHGYPLRVIIPGTIGARQVKWVTKIILSEHESTAEWQKNDYKVIPEYTDELNIDYSKAEAIQEYPVQSSICEPREWTVVEAGDDLQIRGYAWSGGGRGILRVDISIDGGKTWQETQLRSANQRRHRQWAWTLFEATVSVPDNAGNMEVICKAVDTSYNVQPEDAKTIWNIRGYLINSWHHVHIKIV